MDVEAHRRGASETSAHALPCCELAADLKELARRNLRLVHKAALGRPGDIHDVACALRPTPGPAQKQGCGKRSEGSGVFSVHGFDAKLGWALHRV